MGLVFSRRTSAAQPEAAALALVPLANWTGGPAVLLGPADDVQSVADRLHLLNTIAIDFPSFTDGRGYSMARLLRERHGFKGELRAVGEVLRDNLYYLSHCGFDSFALSDQTTATQALEALSDFSDGYQTSVERPLPLFRRRAS
jgi:uncharacterized protein (DUF934 family)